WFRENLHGIRYFPEFSVMLNLGFGPSLQDAFHGFREHFPASIHRQVQSGEFMRLVCPANAEIQTAMREAVHGGKVRCCSERMIERHAADGRSNANPLGSAGYRAQQDLRRGDDAVVRKQML